MTPNECITREDIRREIDRLDSDLVRLLAERFAYVRRMSEIKQDPSEARSAPRVDAVLANVQRLARERDLDADLITGIWTQLIDWNIEWERRAITARQAEDKRR